jgi:hypothetical protein
VGKAMGLETGMEMEMEMEMEMILTCPYEWACRR